MVFLRQFFEIHWQVGLFIFSLMFILWLFSLLLKDSSIVDIFWGFGFVMSVWVAFFIKTPEISVRQWILAAIVTLWGLRLSIHILIRNAGKGEDFRYQKMRSNNGKNWWWQSLFKVFILQGLLMWLIASPLSATFVSSKKINLVIFDYLGFTLWLIGFFFEAFGDIQLTQFRNNPANKGKILNKGVWRFTRHPNYFGDSAQWWGFYLIALAAGGWWTIFSPIIMTYLLIKVSGVALLEKSLIENKPGYKEYAEITSPFIPWFPKKIK